MHAAARARPAGGAAASRACPRRTDSDVLRSGLVVVASPFASASGDSVAVVTPSELR